MIIECRGLTKSYISGGRPLTAVDNVNLHVAKGDFLVILGHSGSGKTTLLSLIGGLTRPDKGNVLIDNSDIQRKTDSALSLMRNRTIGFIFQFSSLIPTLSVMENVLLPPCFGKISGNKKQTAAELLAMVGLKEKMTAFPAELSGGQQRRVAIARAFINRPRIILADEPTGDLDVDTEREILEIFRTFHRQGITFLVVTHNRDLAGTQDPCRIMRMDNGMLAEEGR